MSQPNTDELQFLADRCEATENLLNESSELFHRIMTAAEAFDDEALGEAADKVAEASAELKDALDVFREVHKQATGAASDGTESDESSIDALVDRVAEELKAAMAGMEPGEGVVIHVMVPREETPDEQSSPDISLEEMLARIIGSTKH